MNPTARAVLLIATVGAFVFASFSALDGHVRRYRVALVLALLLVALTWAWDAAVVAW